MGNVVELFPMKPFARIVEERVRFMLGKQRARGMDVRSVEGETWLAFPSAIVCDLAWRKVREVYDARREGTLVIIVSGMKPRPAHGIFPAPYEELDGVAHDEEEEDHDA